MANAVCLVGLAMIGYGLWLIHPSLMWCGIGALATAAGVYIHRNGKRSAAS